MLSRPNGEFMFQNLPAAGSFRLVITALGYKGFEQEIVISAAGEKTEWRNFEKDLGNLSLENNFKKFPVCPLFFIKEPRQQTM